MTVKNSGTPISEVYADIGIILTNAIRSHADVIEKVTANSKAFKAADFTDGAKLVEFVKALFTEVPKTIGELAGTDDLVFTVTYKDGTASETFTFTFTGAN